MRIEKKVRNRYIVLTLLIANIALILYSVSSDKRAEGKFVSNAQEGKILARAYCQSCHSLPDPSLLPKETWVRGALPAMGPFFGIKSFQGIDYQPIKDVGPATFPDKPILDSLQWQKISDYYYNAAPDHLPYQNKNLDGVKILPYFSIDLPKNSQVFGKVSMASYVHIDTFRNPRRVLVSDAMAQKLYIFDDKLNLIEVNQDVGLITDIDFQANQTLSCNLGESVEANNQRKGDVSILKMNRDGRVTKGQVFFDRLARPVKITHADLDKDGRTDYVISEFGNIIGNLSWMRNKGNGTYQKTILRNKPGALNTIIYDYNKDGSEDIWALFAQGNEGIFVYTNNGKGQMKEKQILDFPPSYGSTWFELVDFNHDGYQDIIYTCGDNADSTPILKPYHGVYLYLNDGANNFSQKYFYPINGCYKAIARDFDSDGNIDIAAISFFPSSLQPQEAFTYLKNTGNYSFSPYRLPLNTPFEKGITMDVADLDQDGKLDILLGNGYYNSNEADKHKEPLFIVLKNITPKNSEINILQQ